MFKLEKINSQNSGPHITNDNIIFNLDNYGSLDLSKSYFNIRARIDCTATGATSQGSAYNVSLASVGSTYIPYGNSIFFKHWRFESQKSGVIEDIRNVNMLKANLDCLTRSSSDKKSGNYNSISQYYDDTFSSPDIYGTVFSNLHRLGTVNSSNVVANLKMSVSEVAGVGALDFYDCDKEGLTRGTLQLDTSYVFPVQYSPYRASGAVACDNYTAIGVQALGIGDGALVSTAALTADQQILITVGATVLCTRSIDGGAAATVAGTLATVNAIGGGLFDFTTVATLGAMTDGQVASGISIVVGPLECDDYTSAGAQTLGVTIALVTDSTFPFNSSNLFVGQSIQVYRSIAGAAIAAVETTIASITRDANDNLVITTATSCGALTNGQAVTHIYIGTNTCTMDLVIEDVNLVAVRHMSKPPSPDSQLFSSWNVEQVNVPATTQYNHLFEIEPSTINVLALSPTTATNPISLVDSLTSYRIRVDDIDQTNRDVEFKSSLYYDSLMRTFNNMGSGYQLRNLYPTVGNGVEMAVMTSPISNSPNTQMLQLSYNNSIAGTAKVLSLYKQVVKKL